MVIREYQPTDLSVCRALWTEMTQRHRDIYDDPTIGGEDPGLEFDAHLARVGASAVWVAESDDRVLGFVSLIHDGEEAEVEPLVVRSDARGAGIGHQLVEHAVQRARELGVVCLSVKPVARNEEAIAFFHDAGSRTLGHIQLFMWLGDSAAGQWKAGPELLGKSFAY